MNATNVDVDKGQVAFKDRGVDPALRLIGGVVVEFTSEEEKSVLRNTDWHMLPLICWVYMIQFADKTTLNYASLMGIQKDTNLVSNQYIWVSSIFYAGYLAWEFPTTYLFRRLPVGKYTAITIFCQGIALSCHAATTNYAGLLACRFFLGAFEATVAPAFVLITSMWFRKGEQGRKMNYWLSCNGVALVLMTFICYGLSAITRAHLAPWRILFLLLGLISAVYFWFLPDNQTNAKFLNEREKLIAVERICDNFQGIGSQVWKLSQFREAFLDLRTYLYVLFSALMNIPNGGITTFGSLVVKSFGFSDRTALLLDGPSGSFDIAGKTLSTYLSDKLLDYTSMAFIAILIAMVGSVLMIVVPQDIKPVLLIGYYMISVAGALLGLVMTAISNNTLGYTKKVTVNGLQILPYAAGNWTGPQTFRADDAPEYRRGKALVAIMYGLAGGVLIVIRLVNMRENARRDRVQAAEGVDLEDAEVKAEVERRKFMDLTDFEQLHFWLKFQGHATV
ncbi:major facilitator superfamily domain-containing protein [Aspergillus heterothallicus]